MSGWAQERVSGATGCPGIGEGPVFGQLDRRERSWVFTGIYVVTRGRRWWWVEYRESPPTCADTHRQGRSDGPGGREQQ